MPRSTKRSPRRRSPYAIAFGQILAATRKRHGMSQEALGLAMNSARVYVGEVERGEKAPGLEFVFRAAEVLGTMPSALLRRTERLLTQKRAV